MLPPASAGSSETTNDNRTQAFVFVLFAFKNSIEDRIEQSRRCQAAKDNITLVCSSDHII